MGEVSLIRVVARMASLLAPLPSAWFIGRSVYYHLLYQWHLEVPELVSVAVAAVAGLAIEMLAISSVFLASSLYRWNHHGQVSKEHGWERAPVGVAILVTSIYFLVAIYLLVVLEAIPDLARYSAIAFPVLAAVGAVNWALFQQHQDRLDRYGLKWSFRVRRNSDEIATESRKEPAIPEYKPQGLDLKIMEAYRHEPEASYADISGLLGVGRSTVGSRAKRLKEAGILVATPTGISVAGRNGNG